MSESRRTVDARGLPCPEPVILTRKALAEGGFEVLELIVDDAASRENVLRSATYAGCAIEGVAEEGNVSRILIRPATTSPSAQPPSGAAVLPAPSGPAPQAWQGATVFIASAGIGSGD